MSYKKIIKENDVNPKAKPSLDHHPHKEMPPHGLIRKSRPHMSKIKAPEHA